MTVVPAWHVAFSMLTMLAAVSGSRLPVGSSAIITFGSLSKARAMAIRCCSPPDNSLGILSFLSIMFTWSNTSSMRRAIFFLSVQPVACNTNPKFFATVRSCSNWKSWNIMPICLRRAGMWLRFMSSTDTPNTSAFSASSQSISSSPYIVFNSELLPEPTRPMR